MQVSFLVAVENLSDLSAALQLTDRVPVSETEEVRVSGVKIQPEGKPDAKGLLHWELNLAAKQTKEYRIEYALEYPTELPQRLTPLPSRSATGTPAESSASGLYEQIKSLEKKF